MPQIDRTRDLIIFEKGDTLPVVVSSAMVSGEWAGGQGVAWTTSSRDEFSVTYSDGVANGFMLWGSDEVSDRFTAMTRTQPNYRYGVVGFGGWLISTRNFEAYTYASRVTPPNVALSYAVNDQVYFSLRGLFTKEDEWTLSGDPRAPNTNVVGIVVQPPSTATNGYLTLQLRL